MKVLIAPLNWGIGHASRSVPIINKHLRLGHEVFIASSGDALVFLQRRFPNLKTYNLPDYNIKYHQRIPVWLSVSFQSLGIYKQIKLEQKYTEILCRKMEFDLIISDNRYGVNCPNIYTQLICHQLNPKSPSKRIQLFIEFLHRFLCKPFDEILIPDYKEEHKSLSGMLSKTTLHWPQKITFLNPLSHLRVNSVSEAIEGRILVLLSGVEPKRSILESKIIKSLSGEHRNVVIVGGTFKLESPPLNQVKYYPFLDQQKLEKEIDDAEIIICRSGYSTIMDLHQLINKKIILIPTQGQTEQVYLANYLSLKFKHLFIGSENVIDLKRLIKNITDNN